MPGHTPCLRCEGRYCFVMLPETLRSLPADYHGEWCDQCGLKVVVAKLVESRAAELERGGS